MVLCCSNEKEAAKLFGLYLDHKVPCQNYLLFSFIQSHKHNVIPKYIRWPTARSLSKMSSHYQIKFKTERIVEIIYGCYRYRQFVTDIDINRAEASAIFSFPSPRPRADFQRLSSYQIPSSAISIPSNSYSLKL